MVDYQPLVVLVYICVLQIRQSRYLKFYHITIIAVKTVDDQNNPSDLIAPASWLIFYCNAQVTITSIFLYMHDYISLNPVQLE